MRAFVIGGPTASGKTALAVEVAQALDAVVLSADAMQVYRGMDVGTGKASLDERGGVPHFGFDLREPDEPFDAADFVALADEVLAAHPRVVVAGGTSLYLQALRRGLVATPDPDPAFRAELDGVPDLHGRLAAVDPALAARLHPNDRVRLVRGLEVHALSGERLSDLQAVHAAAPDRVDVDGVWLDRDDLDVRIDARVLAMMARGYLQEARGLLARFDRASKPMRSLGYRHMAACVLGEVDEDEAVRLTQRDTRRFARKQRTWRKHLGLEEPVDVVARARRWFDG